MSTVILQFSDEKEFLEELGDAAEQGRVLERTVRITKLIKSQPALPLQNIALVASFIKPTEPVQLVRLEKFCGVILGPVHDPNKVWERAEAVQAEIVKEADKFRLMNAAGMFSAPEELAKQ